VSAARALLPNLRMHASVMRSIKQILRRYCQIWCIFRKSHKTKLLFEHYIICILCDLHTDKHNLINTNFSLLCNVSRCRYRISIHTYLHFCVNTYDIHRNAQIQYKQTCSRIHVCMYSQQHVGLYKTVKLHQ
jgi:hypothetical protein